jgi:hypothetical protein
MCNSLPTLAMAPSATPDAPFRLTVLGPASVYDAKLGLGQPGFLPGRSLLCPALLSSSSSSSSSAAAVVSTGAAHDAKPLQQQWPMLQHSRRQKKQFGANIGRSMRSG